MCSFPILTFQNQPLRQIPVIVGYVDDIPTMVACPPHFLVEYLGLSANKGMPINGNVRNFAATEIIRFVGTLGSFYHIQISLPYSISINYQSYRNISQDDHYVTTLTKHTYKMRHIQTTRFESTSCEQISKPFYKSPDPSLDSCFFPKNAGYAMLISWIKAW